MDLAAEDSEQSPARIGVIGTDNTHAFPLCGFINGWRQRVSIPAVLPDGRPVPNFSVWATLLRRLATDCAPVVPVRGARVVSVWSHDIREAKLLADACAIDNVCKNADQVYENADSVIILSEDPASHATYARTAFDLGLKTFIDKPMAESPQAAEELFSYASSRNAPCFTSSALRFSPDLLSLKQQIATEDLGVQHVYAQVPATFTLYGIHAVEMADLLLGCDVTVVRAVEGQHRQIALLEYDTGTSALLENISSINWPIYNTSIYGRRWSRHRTLSAPECLLGLAHAVVEFARTGQPPVRPEVSIRLLEIVAAMKSSLATGHAVKLR